MKIPLLRALWIQPFLEAFADRGAPVELQFESEPLGPSTPSNLPCPALRALRVVDPSSFQSRAHNTPFSGMRLKGWPAATIVGGEIVWRAK